ncbi:MAG: lactonase family protein [Mediterranea sp.]|jgi:6-phosphogluconolactonase (cycloisomerase 2 family)|nr:lactonase family protein [Mediterranea sp.]
MQKLLFCAFCLAITACSSRKTLSPDKDPLTLVIGTYTDTDSKGIYTYRFDQKTGKSTLLATTEISNPSYLTASDDGKFIYAVTETDDSTAALSAFALDQATGQLTLLSRQATCGGSPCYVATNGSVALTANYGGGSMSVFPLERNGAVGAVDTLFEGSIGGPDADRQSAAHVHCALFSPDHKYIFATDFSADRIMRFVVHPRSIVPHRSDESVAVDSNTGPRHLTFSPNGRFAYLIGELSGMITAFRYDDGSLQKIQTITADTLHARGSADIRLSPDGKYLYASNRLKGDGIAIFEVNTETGMLCKVGYQHTGVHPRNFNITPNGKYLLAACRDDNVIQVFRRDSVSGLLTDTHQDIRLSKPVCVEFVKPTPTH